MNLCYELSDNESKAIDISKLFFSIMVVFIHVYGTTFIMKENSIELISPDWFEAIKTLLSRIISACAVPAFFFYSSLLLYRKNFTWKSNVKKKLKTLFVPYIILNVFWILFDFFTHSVSLFQNYLGRGNYFLEWGVRDWIDAFTGIFSGYPFLYPLWFIRDLMLLNVLAIVIRKCIDKIPEIFLGIIIVIYLTINTNLIIAQDFEGIYNHEITALFFWSLGYYFVKYGIQLNRIDKVKIYKLIIPYLLLITLSFLLEKSSFLFAFSIHRLCIIIGLLFWYKMSYRLTTTSLSKLLIFFSNYSFSIFIFHEKNLTAFRKICISFLPNSLITALFMYFMVPFIIIICCIVLSVIMNKFTPHIYSLVTGSRTFNRKYQS